MPTEGVASNSRPRRSIEEALRDNEEGFRFIADQLPNLVCMSDTQMQCIWVNRTRLEFTGRSMHQEMGSGSLESAHPDDVELLLKIYGEAFAQRKPFSVEYRLRRHDGEYRWFLTAAHPLFDEQGEFKGYLSSALDISDQKALLDALLLSEARVRTAIERSLHPIMLHAEGGEIIMLSDSWTDLSGYSLEEIPTTKDWVEKAYGISREKPGRYSAGPTRQSQPAARAYSKSGPRVEMSATGTS